MTLVCLPADRCPDCGAVLAALTTHEPPLLRHGGYGATRRTVTRLCPCGWALTAAVDETHPTKETP